MFSGLRTAKGAFIAGQVSTQYDVPGAMESGLADLVVVANGIPSAPISVNVR